MKQIFEQKKKTKKNIIQSTLNLHIGIDCEMNIKRPFFYIVRGINYNIHSFTFQNIGATYVCMYICTEFHTNANLLRKNKYTIALSPSHRLN